MIRKLFLLSLVYLLSVPAFAQSITLVPIATGLDSPLAVEHAGDGSGDLYMVEQGGRILVWRNGSVLPTPLLDIQDRVGCCMERGLLGLAFHPDYPENGEFFVNYTDTNFDTIIARFTKAPGASSADPGSEEILLTIDQPFSNHNGGQLTFGPDGYLYIGTGDGGGGGDPQDNAQDPLSLLGKMLRIDVDSGNPYAIPADNPFASTDFELDEIWALGLRNPFRFSFDSITGDLYIADVGQDQLEEVHVHRANTPAGENYGWRLMEGTSCFNPASSCNDGSLTLPAFEYSHVQGRCSITGGYVYRGSDIPALAGAYVYGDYCTGEIFRADYSAGAWSQEGMLSPGYSISSFGQDEDGEIYVVDLGGAVYRLAPALEISPASGGYLTTQVIDLAFILRKQGVLPINIDVSINGANISAAVNNCLREGQLAAGGLSFRCPGIPLSLLPGGTYEVSVSAVLSDGSTLTDSVTWEILETTEP